MQVTCSLRAIIRSHEHALKDVKNVYAAIKRFGVGENKYQPPDAQCFSVTTQGPMILTPQGLLINPNYPRIVWNMRKNKTEKMIFGCRWALHRSAYFLVHESLTSRENIVHGSRDALKRIIEAIRKKDLSLLSPLLLDDSILADITKKSNLSSLTNRQLSCLDVSDEDFIGLDGIVDRWKRDKVEDDPSGILSSISLKLHKKELILSYSVDMMAILRKNVLVSKMGPNPPPRDKRGMPAPRAYGLPWMRVVYATVEFAHVGTGKLGQFSKEPFLYNFHVHSL